MSTGDLKNNLRKLQLEMRRIQYPKDADLDSLTKGIVSEYLPIYHYVMVSYSRPVAEQISNMGMELTGKTDLRFIESMYKILRELFSYKPSITKDQFFSSGFAERKVIMCTEIINLVHKRHLQLGPKAKVKIPHSNISSSGTTGLSMVPKALSASHPSMSFSGASSTDDARHSVYKQPKAKPKSGILNRSAAMATIGGRGPSGQSNVKSRVVNELRTRSPKAATEDSPIRATCISDADMSPPIVMKDSAHDVRSPNCGSAEVRNINSSTPTRFEEKQEAKLEALEKKLSALELQTDERLFCLEEKISRIEKLVVNMEGLNQGSPSETSPGVTSNVWARLTMLETKMDAVLHQIDKIVNMDGIPVSPSLESATSAGKTSNILARLTLLENRMDIFNMQNKSGLSENSGPCNKSGSWSPTRDSDAVDDKKRTPAQVTRKLQQWTRGQFRK
jgi:centrosomal protein CEP44